MRSRGGDGGADGADDPEPPDSPFGGKLRDDRSRTFRRASTPRGPATESVDCLSSASASIDEPLMRIRPSCRLLLPMCRFDERCFPLRRLMLPVLVMLCCVGDGSWPVEQRGREEKRLRPPHSPRPQARRHDKTCGNRQEAVPFILSSSTLSAAQQSRFWCICCS